MNLVSFKGELAALSAALIWAIASFVYVIMGRQIPPLVLNFAKCTIAIILSLLTLWLMGDFSPGFSLQTGMLPLGLLLVSGALGIGLGDTAFFEALNCLGARRSLLIEALAPPLAALFAAIFLNETLNSRAWIGIFLTVGGVTWVILERVPNDFQGKLHLWRGIGFGVLSALAQASGAVLSRAALAETSVSPLWGSLIRLLAGVFILLILMICQRQVWAEFYPLRDRRFLLSLITTSFASTYLGIWLQQIALKFTATGIAQALTATSPLFVIPIALWMREKVSLRSILGAVLALLGIWALFDVK
ncbi:MAG: DMT family transporter [Timaviella obliquedivisa GSE-PSE-MK23-08B]|jgi:drug/metabolite transporter (DMT)-like permease|nr:DMT family transporter [Timaviella obliquedivisa GSE-PSE-MK23-08B]